ncbi:MAG: HAD-IA family hydrolase [Melioribacteraceae bacterium]|nr:HAD-IA family hydrolase [Melioribacteraceae bacterium]
MNKFDGIIFDIDGTITATNKLIFATFNHVTEKYLNRTFTPKEITAYFGPTEKVIIKEIIGKHYNEAMDDYHQYYRANHSRMARAFDGIIDIIKELKNRDILLSIYTGKGRPSSEITLEEIGVINYFDMIVTGDDIAGDKPSPEGVDVFINKYNLNRDRVLMVGDAPPDVKAARATGIKIASVLWDSYAKEEVLQMESDFYFDTVIELSEFLLD